MCFWNSAFHFRRGGPLHAEFRRLHSYSWGYLGRKQIVHVLQQRHMRLSVFRTNGLCCVQLSVWESLLLRCCQWKQWSQCYPRNRGWRELGTMATEISVNSFAVLTMWTLWHFKMQSGERLAVGLETLFSCFFLYDDICNWVQISMNLNNISA